jgi:hypothetical protein
MRQARRLFQSKADYNVMSSTHHEVAMRGRDVCGICLLLLRGRDLQLPEDARYPMPVKAIQEKGQLPPVRNMESASGYATCRTS